MINKEFWKGKRVLVTGHTGFKGAWLCHWLLNMGAETIGYALEAGDPSLFRMTGLERNIHSITGDTRDFRSLNNIIQANKLDIIIHLAAQPLVRESYKNPVYTYETNILGTVNLLEAARGSKTVRSIVNVTTDKVYENKEWYWGYRENENLCGYDPYSNSKSCSELVTFSYKNSFFQGDDAPAISTARAGNVIGGGDFAEDRIISDCYRAASKSQTVTVRNPDSTRPYQHVLDCLSGYLLLAEKQYNNKKYEGSYNFGPDDQGCISTSKLVDLFCKYWGEGQSWLCQEDHIYHEANFLRLDCSKAKAVLKWSPKWGIEEAVEKTVACYKYCQDREKTAECVHMQIKQYCQTEI